MIIKRFLGKILFKVSNIKSRFIAEYKGSLVNLPAGSKISSDVHLRSPQNISIGRNTYMNGGYLFASNNAKITIGDNCLISYNVHMRTDSHNYKKLDLINQQGMLEKDIIIGSDVWVGFGAQIMSGVTIGKGAVIGAGAIVTKNVEEYVIVAGVPAVEIGRRTISGKIK